MLIRTAEAEVAVANVSEGWEGWRRGGMGGRRWKRKETGMGGGGGVRERERGNKTKNKPTRQICGQAKTPISRRLLT